MSLSGKNKRNILVRLAILLLVIIDLGVKYMLFHYFGNQTGIIAPMLNNRGARSLNIPIAIIIIVSIVAISGFVYLWQTRTIASVSFVFLTAGAIGNMYDRIVIGAVRDWIHIGAFPVFNLADVMITIGVLLIALHLGRRSRELRK